MNILQKLMSKGKKQSKKEVEVNLVPCEVCEGSGLKLEPGKSRKEATELCPNCEGSGQVEE